MTRVEKDVERASAGLGERFERLAEVMARLRSPGGCPWDLEQTPRTLTRHLLEEAYETVEAINEEDWDHLSEELGDLLLQIVFQARIAEEQGRFDLGDVVGGITEKLKRRHPHIFGSAQADSASEVSLNWERIKREEEGREPVEVLGLPAMMAALKVQRKAARDGFDWESVQGVFLKLEEETEELREAAGAGGRAAEREFGDLLFTVVNLARHLGVDPEMSLRGAARDFLARYSWMEEQAELQGKALSDMGMDEKEELWREAKLALEEEL